MNHKPRLIYNPAANNGGAAKILPKIESLLQQAGFEYDLVLTEFPHHAESLARHAAEEGCLLVIAAGGDGTVNEVINGLMTSDISVSERPSFAVLPVGRGNDFAYGVGIPHDIAEALDVLVNAGQQAIDIGRVTGGDYPQGRFFGNGVGLGFDTVVGFEAAKIKWLHGAASYLAALVRTIFLYAKAPVYEITMDDVVLHQPFLMVSIMNGRRMGGMFMMAPNSSASDGMFDLCLAGQVPQIRILPLAAKFIGGTQAEHPAVKMVRAHNVMIRATQGTIPAHADGETICEAGQALTIELLPASLKVVSRLNGALA